MNLYLPFIAILKNTDLLFQIENHFPDFFWENLGTPNFKTTYYEKEMGNKNERFFIFSREQVPFFVLSQMKKKAKSIEDNFLNSRGSRKLNLDPGLIGLHQVVVSTFKNYSHRIPIHEDPPIWEDLQLIYEGKSFKTFPWTYPDYQELIPEFKHARKGLLLDKSPQ